MLDTRRLPTQTPRMEARFSISARAALILVGFLLGAPSVPVLVLLPIFWNGCAQSMAIALVVASVTALVNLVVIAYCFYRASRARKLRQQESALAYKTTASCVSCVGMAVWLGAAVASARYCSGGCLVAVCVQTHTDIETHRKTHRHTHLHTHTHTLV